MRSSRPPREPRPEMRPPGWPAGPASQRKYDRTRRTGHPSTASVAGRSKHPVEMPPVGDAFQLLLASVFEHQPRAHGEIFDRGADQNLPRAGERSDPCGNVHREAADLVAGEFDLAGVAAGADVQAELADGCAQGLGAADGPGGPVEGR